MTHKLIKVSATAIANNCRRKNKHLLMRMIAGICNRTHDQNLIKYVSEEGKHYIFSISERKDCGR